MTASLDNIAATSADAAGLDLSGMSPLHPWLPHIVMFTLPNCGNCDRLKILFKAAKFPVVGIPVDPAGDVYRLLTDELGVQQTPVVLVHNAFDETKYFSGFDSDRARIVIESVFARLRVLEQSVDPVVIERFLTDMIASIEPGERYPFIRPQVFASMSANHLGYDGVPPARTAMPSLLSKSRSEVPPLLG